MADNSDDRKFMEVAVEEARKSKDEDDRAHPRVGVVVVKDGVELARAHRGELKPGDHGEYTVLEKLKDVDVSGSTVYASLEPCTTRNHPKIPCARRLIERKVGRVVIGMLDPNRQIRGNGEWQLIDAGIQIGRFDSDLMVSLVELNHKFRRAQESLGLRITSPVDGETCSRGLHKVSGTFVNPPGRNVFAITRIGGRYWPQIHQPVDAIPGTENRWETTVDFGVSLPHTIYIVKASKLGIELINYYSQQLAELYRCGDRIAQKYNITSIEAMKVVNPGGVFPGFAFAELPSGLDHEASVTVNVSQLALPRG